MKTVSYSKKSLWWIIFSWFYRSRGYGVPPAVDSCGVRKVVFFQAPWRWFWFASCRAVRPWMVVSFLVVILFAVFFSETAVQVAIVLGVILGVVIGILLIILLVEWLARILSSTASKAICRMPDKPRKAIVAVGSGVKSIWKYEVGGKVPLPAVIFLGLYLLLHPMAYFFFPLLWEVLMIVLSAIGALLVVLIASIILVLAVMGIAWVFETPWVVNTVEIGMRTFQSIKDRVCFPVVWVD